MATILKIDPLNPEPRIIEKATALIALGKIIVYPTDTIYGLGVNALDRAAVVRVFEAKKRPMGLPLPVAVKDEQMAGRFVAVNDQAQRLMNAFWPGALTLVLPKKAAIPDEVTSGRNTLAIRAPNHQVPLRIIAKTRLPLTATSANIHGRADPKDAGEAADQIGKKVDLVLDGGPTTGLASTVLDLTGNRPRILREGPITRAGLRQIPGLDVD